MARLKEMAPLGIFILPAVVSTIVVLVLATAAPAAFCAGLDPDSSTLMDGIGGEFLRMVFFHCRTGN